MPKPKFQIDYASLTTAKGDPLSASSVRIYKAALNKLAAEGYTTPQDLREHAPEIVKHLEATLSAKQARRVALSAVFRAISPDQPDIYYQAYLRAKEDFRQASPGSAGAGDTGADTDTSKLPPLLSLVRSSSSLV